MAHRAYHDAPPKPNRVAPALFTAAYVVVAALQTAFSLLISLGILRLIQYALIKRDPNSALGQGLTFFIGTV
jgi:hypothetical protein